VFSDESGIAAREGLLSPALQPLIELQALDLRIAELKEHQRQAPQLLEAAEGPLKEATRRLNDAKAALEQAAKERRERERDLEAHEAQTDKMKSRLSELKTNKEYQAHLFEIEMANKKRGDIEEQILVLMERIDQKQKESKEAQAVAAEADTVFAQERQRLEARGAELAAELSLLEAKQRTLSATIDKALIERYIKLKATRKDLALAPIRNGICGGCRLQIPPQLIAEVKRSDELLTCSYCQRILYWDGEIVVPPPPSSDALEEAEETV
jgi:predicted  nucleic acid-binding Zn-ribbon protein